MPRLLHHISVRYPTARSFQGQWSKNAKYEYCHLFCNSIFKVPKGKSDIKATANGPDEHVF